MLVLDFYRKSELQMFVDFRRPHWRTKTVHQYGVSIQRSTRVRESFREITEKLSATKTKDLGKLFIYISLL